MVNPLAGNSTYTRTLCLYYLAITVFITLSFQLKPLLWSCINDVSEFDTRTQVNPNATAPDNEPNRTRTGLRAIVTGLEHSATTLMGALLNNAPCVIGAFETGFLLADTPQRIEEVKPWFRAHTSGAYADISSAVSVEELNKETNPGVFNYRLTSDDILHMKNASDLLEMYDILRTRSFLFNDLDDAEYCEKPYEMIDKTPRYVHWQHFQKILEKTPNVPVVVMQKSFDKTKKSWDKRGGKLTKEFYEKTYDTVWQMKMKYPGRILLVYEEDLMKYPKAVLQDVFPHVGLEWKDEYLQMEGALKKVSNYPILVKVIQQYKFEAGKHSFDRRQENAVRKAGALLKKRNVTL